MEITIGPYKLLQRTEYSKIRLFDIEKNKDISSDMSLINKIMEDYNKQLEFKDIFFEINNGCLTQVKDAVEAENIKYLFIPEGITSIGPRAIKYQEMEFIKLPDTLKKINEYALSYCDKLKYIDIPNSVTEIGFDAFRSCYKLEKINLPNINVIEQSLCCCCYSLKEVVIPDSVEYIKDCAFCDCGKLENVKLSKKIKKIFGSAFQGCYSLSKIDLPYGLSVIGHNAFAHSGLEEIIIPDSVNRIYNSAFISCEELRYIRLPNELEIISDKMFSSCIKLNNITFPDTIISLGENIFYNAHNIKNINIPKNLHEISNLTFADSSLESLTFNYDLENLQTGVNTLISHTNIYKLIISNSVSKITTDAFKTSGSQITSIDYLGTKEQFEAFKKNNEDLFVKCLTNVKEVTFIEYDLEHKFADKDTKGLGL